jgi:alkylation response protein AidB-like acyl-CoA dehydrogenase
VQRTLFNDEHRQSRSLSRDFSLRECAPHVARWEDAGCIDRHVWNAAGAVGLLGWEAPEALSGLGLRDYPYNAILAEECVATGCGGSGAGSACITTRSRANCSKQPSDPRCT